MTNSNPKVRNAIIPRWLVILGVLGLVFLIVAALMVYWVMSSFLDDEDNYILTNSLQTPVGFVESYRMSFRFHPFGTAVFLKTDTSQSRRDANPLLSVWGNGYGKLSMIGDSLLLVALSYYDPNPYADGFVVLPVSRKLPTLHLDYQLGHTFAAYRIRERMSKYHEFENDYYKVEELRGLDNSRFISILVTCGPYDSGEKLFLSDVQSVETKFRAPRVLQLSISWKQREGIDSVFVLLSKREDMGDQPTQVSTDRGLVARAINAPQ